LWNNLNKYSDPVLTWENHYQSLKDQFEAQSKPDGYPDRTYTIANHFSSRQTALLFAPRE